MSDYKANDKKHYIREDKEHFFQWLLRNNKGTEKECAKLVSYVRRWEDFAKEQISEDLKLFSADTTVVARTYEELSNNKEFRLKNKKADNWYLYALVTYMDYIANCPDRPVARKTGTLVQNKTAKTQTSEKTIKPSERNAKRIKSKDFLVRVWSFSCRSKKHKCKDITACVTVMHRNNTFQDVYLPAWYCETCGCYYISENDYEYLDRVGVIVAEVFTEKSWNSGRYNRSDFSELNAKSTLRKLGYNVNASDGLNDSERQRIMASVVDFKIMSRTEVIDFLTWLISTRSGSSRYQDAICLWRKDIDFISRYKLNTKEYVKIKSLWLRDLQEIG